MKNIVLNQNSRFCLFSDRSVDARVDNSLSELYLKDLCIQVYLELANTIKPRPIFDVALPVWRVGETLLQAQRLAGNLFDGPTTISFIATYEGLSCRTLTSIDHRRHVWERQVSRQNSITLNTHVDAQAIDTNLPEIVHPLLSPLYALFDFFELSTQLVAEELARMRGGRY